MKHRYTRQPATHRWYRQSIPGGIILSLLILSACSTTGTAVGSHFSTPASQSACGAIGASQSFNPGSVRWRFHFGATPRAVPVAVADGVLYVVSPAGVGATPANAGTSPANVVYALDASAGTRRWRFRSGGTFFTPVVSNGLLYVASYDGNVYALNT